MRLYEKLLKYHDTDLYPFHMPGHKRNKDSVWIEEKNAFPFPLEQDITEITGFDNLHHAQDLILDLQRDIAKLYGVKESFLSVNGSTAALISAIHACVKPGGKILVARNCHKAVYHAMYVRNLQPVYIYPQIDTNCGLIGGILPENVENLLKNNSEIQAVLITSPTYDGIVSDVEKIAEIAHEHGIPLIVDEAHGAHFCFSEYFPTSAADLGADLVIQSLHKTLPAMTQTSVLHNCSDMVDSNRIARFMGIYQTSSPSYILMASIDACADIIEKRGQELFANYTDNLEKARTALRNCKNIPLLEPRISKETGVFDFDRSKILLGGQGLHSVLRERFHMEMEMEAEHYVTALTSVGDTKEGFDRLVHAIQTLDKEIVYGTENSKNIESEYPLPQICMSLTEAMEAKAEKVFLENSENRISSEFVYLYPPGIPIVAPGERITGQLLENMRKYKDAGLKLEGMSDKDAKYLKVIVTEQN
ncbi:MAG: aminotransferase class I/II-fold pyridoxal phosphate-dependent enzyme [Eubacteriales bacterium]|nr:aminotransferase class I/II-fold pyridoxal phosphate-dependent enzyme [Eubacteriales bacterium]